MCQVGTVLTSYHVTFCKSHHLLVLIRCTGRMLRQDEGDTDMSSWSDLSLIIEGIRVRREPDTYKPYLLTQMR